MSGDVLDMRRDSFLRGAFILLLGSLASRVLGAVYRFILPWLMGGGDEGAYGMALFGMPYSIYSIALVLSTMGVPLAISKLVSEARTRNSPGEVRQVFFVSLILLAATGAIVSTALYLLAPYLAHNVWQNPDAYFSMVALAPAVFFVSVMSAFRGLFQGLQTMTPHAISQIVEQIVRVGTMFILVTLLVPYGLEYAAAGATFGATTGAVVGVFYLFVVYWVYRRMMWAGERETDSGQRIGTGQLVREIIGFAIPISVSGIILPLMRFVDAAVVPSRLIASGYSETAATTAYGYLEAYSWPLVNVPAIFTTAMVISLVPSISSSLASGDRQGIRDKALSSLRLGALVGVPAATGLYVLATEIPDFFWGSPEAGPVLAALSGVAIFMTLQQISSASLQGLGYPIIPMRNLVVGASVKFVLTWFLTSVPTMAAAGAGIASVVGFLLAAALNLASLGRYIGSFSIVSFLWRPALASAVMGVAVRIIAVTVDAHYGTGVAVMGAVTAGVFAYFLLVLLIGGVQFSDVAMIPRVGPRVASFLRNVGLVRT